MLLLFFLSCSLVLLLSCSLAVLLSWYLALLLRGSFAFLPLAILPRRVIILLEVSFALYLLLLGSLIIYTSVSQRVRVTCSCRPVPILSVYVATLYFKNSAFPE